MDEVSTLGVNHVCKLEKGELTEASIDPAELGFAKADVSDLVGGDATQNAAIIEGILGGTLHGPKRDIAVMNAAAGFVITGKAATLQDGKALAESLLDRGAAHVKMRALQDWC